MQREGWGRRYGPGQCPSPMAKARSWANATQEQPPRSAASRSRVLRAATARGTPRPTLFTGGFDGRMARLGVDALRQDEGERLR